MRSILHSRSRPIHSFPYNVVTSINYPLPGSLYCKLKPCAHPTRWLRALSSKSLAPNSSFLAFSAPFYKSASQCQIRQNPSGLRTKFVACIVQRRLADVNRAMGPPLVTSLHIPAITPRPCSSSYHPVCLGFNPSISPGTSACRLLAERPVQPGKNMCVS